MAGVPQIIDRHGQPLRASAYRGAGTSHPVLARWPASLRSGHASLRDSRESLSSRIHDLARNDGWASAATSRFVDTVIGTGWRLSAQPNYRSLGIEPDAADEVGDQIEPLWHDYVNDAGFWCDAERMSNMTGLLAMATRHFFADGEALGWLGMRDDAPPYMLSTMLQVIDPVRLCNPNGKTDTATLRDGVELDGNGAAIGYWIRKAHPGDIYVTGVNPYVWEYFDRETEWGRPVIIHLRDRQWAGMSRSASPLAPVVTKLKQVTSYDDAELQAAMLNAILAAFVTTPLDPEIATGSDDISSQAQSEAAYYGQHPIELPDGVAVTMLHPGNRIETIKAEHPSSNFESFMRTALRNIASAGGMSYEALTADFSQANYSSIRAALVEFRKSFESRKATIAATFMGQIYRAFLEEVFDRRLIDIPAGVPSFEAAPTAWSHATWIGAGAGWVDPQKEAEGSGTRMAIGTSTLERECADQGLDWKETIRQRAKERREMIAHGLDPDAARLEARIQSEQNRGKAEEPDERDARENAAIASAAKRRTSLVPQIPLGR